MMYEIEISCETDEGLDNMLQFLLSDRGTTISEIRVDGLSDDELKARILIVADSTIVEAVRKRPLTPP